MSDIDRQSMMEVYTFEMSQMLEQLEQIVIEAENSYNSDQINEIFRIMHTIKGSSAMMLFNNISAAAHVIEDMFYYIREKNPKVLDYSKLTDHVLESMDFLKDELTKIQEGDDPNGDPADVNKKISEFLAEVKNSNGDGAVPKAPAVETAPKTETGKVSNAEAKEEKKSLDKAFTSQEGLKVYDAVLHFEDGCEMENVRAYTLIYYLKNLVHDVTFTPEDLIDEASIEVIRKNGFHMVITTDDDYETIYNYLSSTVYAREVILEEAKAGEAAVKNEKTKEEGTDQAPAKTVSQDANKDAIKAEEPVKQADKQAQAAPKAAPAEPSAAAKKDEKPAEKAEKKEDSGSHPAQKKAPVQSMISVNVNKLDNLMKLIGELVIIEAMVTQNPDLEKLRENGENLESFDKETRQLRKIIGDMQETIMSTRMLTLSPTFFKMNRIVRDMCKQLGKDVNLEILGEDTEVDKNIIESIGDPVMHIVRNAVDHGIETPEGRRAAGKPVRGTITLEAKNIGNDVIITVSDDGQGLDKDRIMEKAQRNGLLRKAASDYTEKEIYQFIFLPGFSTNEQVTSYSGRGVGMDVVTKNLEVIQGTTTVDSVPGEGSVFTMKIPLTLAIIKGMTIKMGGEKYTVPIDAISTSFQPSREDMFVDPNGNEMITVMGDHLNVVKLYEYFGMPEAAREIEDGIMMIVQNGDDRICLFIDELVDEQSVVVKNLPKYMNKVPGLSGCTLLGNGDISLILEIAAFFDR